MWMYNVFSFSLWLHISSTLFLSCLMSTRIAYTFSLNLETKSCSSFANNKYYFFQDKFVWFTCDLSVNYVPVRSYFWALFQFITERNHIFGIGGWFRTVYGWWWRFGNDDFMRVYCVLCYLVYTYVYLSNDLCITRFK